MQKQNETGSGWLNNGQRRVSEVLRLRSAGGRAAYRRSPAVKKGAAGARSGRDTEAELGSDEDLALLA